MGNIALCRYSSQSRLRALSSSPTRMEQVQNTVAWHQSSLPDRENAMLLPCHDQLIIMKGLTRPCCPDLPLVLTMCLQWGARIQASAWCCTQPCVVEPLPASLWPPSMLHAVPTDSGVMGPCITAQVPMLSVADMLLLSNCIGKQDEDTVARHLLRLASAGKAVCSSRRLDMSTALCIKCCCVLRRHALADYLRGQASWRAVHA